MPRLAIGLGFLAAVAVVYFFVDPISGGLPVCPFYWMTHLYCPGCGSQRAMHALLHGEVSAAVAYNPLLVLALLYGLIESIIWLSNRFRQHVRPLSSYKWMPWIVFCIIMAFWLVRNVPVAPFTALAPQ